jgi:hypothetical protein
MKQNQFYCVACRKKVTIPSEDICVKIYNNKRSGKTPALRAYCEKCKVNLTKFIKRASTDRMLKKYGRC